ncbi:Prefoldin subunit-domain-containing protein [Phyllosticta capitalensis]|uniref:Prefoldin subunit-domain-containing protein n=1 Tax=Phyllosticta capitalensis TaxID=121624 RepID=UPI00313153A1
MAQATPMNAEARDHLSDLERQRLRLEDQLEQLRKSLRHWQTWDAEYEGLKEEIQALQEKEKGDPSADQILAAGRDFAGELVNEKEIRELLGPNLQRAAGQVIDVISRRQDYVQQNVTTVQKQVDATEDKLNKVLIISNPSLQDEEGGPLMDIREELDDEGNVVTSSVQKAGASAPKIVEALRKAGVTELQDEPKQQTQETVNGEGNATDKGKGRAMPWEPATPTSDKIHIDLSKLAETDAPSLTRRSSEGSILRSPADEEPRRKKSVTFTPDTKPPAAAAPAASSQPQAEPEPVQRTESLQSYANFKPGSRIVELDDNDMVINAEQAGVPPAVIPDDESPEDAALRREMLEYSLNEVGNVVAELDLYNDTDDDDDDWVSEDDDYDEDEEIEEDEWGRSRPTVSEEYVQKMRELEEKLNARMIENVGPQAPADADVNEVLQQAQGFHRLVVKTDEQIPPALLPRRAQEVEKEGTTNGTAPSASPVPERKKSVTFADDVDIAPPATTSTAAGNTSAPSPPEQPAAPAVNPIADAVVERAAPSSQPSATTTTTPTPSLQQQEEAAPKKRQSRFKSARAAASDSDPALPHTPTPPTNATIASNILERPPSVTRAPPSAEDAAIDPATLSSELMSEYHRARNRLIARQPGGFMAREGEATEGVVGKDGEGAGAEDLYEEREDGRVRKVSRFKAARVRGPGPV